MVEVTFDKLRVPNFIKTDKGTFKLEELSKEEIQRYADLWKFAILSRWEGAVL